MTDTLPSWAMEKARELADHYFVAGGHAHQSLVANVATALISAYQQGKQDGHLASYGSGWEFKVGDRVTKIKGSSWTGHVVGFYSTSLTPVGYDVESETETGSVQIYPEAAIRRLDEVQDDA